MASLNLNIGRKPICFCGAAPRQAPISLAHTGLGVARFRQRRLPEALASFDKAIEINPDLADTHLYRAFVWLMSGNWAEGWPESEWRCETSNFRRFDNWHRRWHGSPLDGKTLLVQGEQGLGDTIQFIRYVPLIEKAGGRVIVQCRAGDWLIC